MSTYDKLGQYSATELPIAPSNLAITAAYSTSADLTWTNNNGTSGVIIAQLWMGNYWLTKNEFDISATGGTMTELPSGEAWRIRIAVLLDGVIYPSAPVVNTLPPALVAAWTFDNDDLTDSSGNGNDLTIGGGVAGYDDGIINRCLFSPDDSYLIASAIESTINGTNSFTTAFWLFPLQDHTGYYATLTGNLAGMVHEDKYLKYFHRDEINGTTIQTLSADTWYHIAYSFNGIATKVYVNGELKETIIESNSITANGDYWTYMTADAKIDNWYLYNGELSLAEIQALYNEGVV